jgi:alpha-glucosidase
MPYLYTTAEETSRDGIPIIRPLFLEFPHATIDSHPLDLDAPGEFFFGPSILVAASPLPDDIAPYEVHLPPGIWYDYWTGAKLDRRAALSWSDLEVRDPTSTLTPTLPPVMVQPGLGDLPIYVRSGAIIPMQPLVQSTEDQPNGPLTLRVFVPAAGGLPTSGDSPASGSLPASGGLPAAGGASAPGDDCHGDLYTDDGKSYDFLKGAYLRLHLTCSVAADGSLTVNIPQREGSFNPWWSEFRIEAVGFTPQTAQAIVDGHSTALEHTPLGWAATIPDSGNPQTIVLH